MQTHLPDPLALVTTWTPLTRQALPSWGALSFRGPTVLIPSDE